MTQGNTIELTAEVVAAYATSHKLSSVALTALINEVHAALNRASTEVPKPVREALTPAISVKKSVTPDHIVCLEDGLKFKALKRHLRTYHDLSPDEYRSKWSLPSSYPIVAPNYAKARSALAKKIGLGNKRRR